MFLFGFNKWLSMVVLKSNRLMPTRRNYTLNVEKENDLEDYFYHLQNHKAKIKFFSAVDDGNNFFVAIQKRVSMSLIANRSATTRQKVFST